LRNELNPGTRAVIFVSMIRERGSAADATSCRVSPIECVCRFSCISISWTNIRAKFVVAIAALLPVLALGAGTGRAQTAGESASVAQVDATQLAKANAGDAAAQVQVGESYARVGANEHDREEAGKDYEQAAAWYKEAADQNNIAGELHLAALYRDGGTGFARDMTQAAAWYRKAADHGDVDAQATLGVLYSMGQGVPQSDVEAYFWLDLAADVSGPNQEKYATNRLMVGQRITTDELADVQDRVARWEAAHPRPDNTK
jgi:TPR repeat protein